MAVVLIAVAEGACTSQNVSSVKIKEINDAFAMIYQVKL